MLTASLIDFNLNNPTKKNILLITIFYLTIF